MQMIGTGDRARSKYPGDDRVKRLQSSYIQTEPSRRPLKIFATDPMLGRTVGNRITIDVANERLMPGPQGSRIEVIDYDGNNK
jgi:hypothetical protein